MQEEHPVGRNETNPSTCKVIIVRKTLVEVDDNVIS